jgi:23S rRNA (guanosine2251-2'-O)-methyltransferase
MLIYGINPVLEAIRSGRVRDLRVSERGGGRVQDVVSAASAAGIQVRRVAPADLDRATRGGVHQGAVADVKDREGFSVADLVTAASGSPLIVVLDGIEDPHNLGAILRTVDAAGADGVVRQLRHAAPLGGAAAKAAAGAASHVRIADVVNIARAIDELKEAGVWTVGLAGDSPKRYDHIDLTVQ